MVNNDRFIETMLVTDGLPIKILDILKERNFLNSEIALMNMIKNYRLCYKDMEYVYLSILVDLCIIDRRKKELNPCLNYVGGYEIFNTFGTPCYDWGMICKFSQVAKLKEHITDTFDVLKILESYIIQYLEDIDYDYKATIALREICDFMTTPLIIDKKQRIKINDNYSLAEYDGGVILVNTEYGYDQWVKVGFPIGNVYVSIYNMILAGFGGKDSIIIRREYYPKIYECLQHCYKSTNNIVESKSTGHFVNGERFLKLKFGD